MNHLSSWEPKSGEEIYFAGDVTSRVRFEIIEFAKTRPLYRLATKIIECLEGPFELYTLWNRSTFAWYLERALSEALNFFVFVLVYGGSVALILAALFAIDLLYRHFAS